MRRRSKSTVPPELKGFLSLLNLKKFNLPSLGLGVSVGVFLGGHFFDPPPPPLFQLNDKTRLLSCFTPQHQCLPLILKEINTAKKEILVQAFSLTSKPLMNALSKAKSRGVRVRILVDKTQDTPTNERLKALKKEGIEIFIDSKPAIAHNKLLIIDRTIVIGGSYNFSDAAEFSNAENVFILSNAPLVHQYRENWLSRFKVSRLPRGL